MRSLLKFIFEYERKNNSEMSGVLSANWSSNSGNLSIPCQIMMVY